MEENMSSNMQVTEMKRKGLKKAILSLLVEWKDLEDHFDSCPNLNPTLNQLQYHQHAQDKSKDQGLDKNQVESSSQNPMHDKLKETDVSNGSCDHDRVEVLENEVEKLKERWERLVSKEKEVGRVEVLCKEKLKEIDGKLKEMEFSRNFMEERAKELDLKQKELDDGFRDLESRKLELIQIPRKSGGVLCSSADMVGSKSSQERPPHLGSTNHALRESCEVQNAIPRASHSLDTNLNNNQPTQSDLTDSRKTLHTSCPFCNTIVQYPKDFYTGGLCCSSCSKRIVVNDSGPHNTVLQANQDKSGAPAETLCVTQDQPDISQQKRVPRLEEINLGALESEKFPPSSMDYERNPTYKLKKLNRAKKAEGLTVSEATLKTRGKEYQRSNTEDKSSPSANVNPSVLRNLRSTRRRREIDLSFGSVGKFDTTSGSRGPDLNRDADVISSSAGMAASKFSQREQPYHLRSKNHSSRESCAVQREIPKFSDSSVTKLKHQQPIQPEMLNSKQTFEICPFCTAKFQYTKYTSNGSLFCPSCSKQIVANDTSPGSAVRQANKEKSNAPAGNLRSTRGQPALCQQKRVPKWEAINLGPPKAKGLDVDDAILKTRGKEYQRVCTEDTVLPNANVNPRESLNMRKRKREIHLGSGSVGRSDTRNGSTGPDPEKIADNVFARMMSDLYKVHIPEEGGYMSFNRESKKSRLCSNPLEDQNRQTVDNVEVELCDSAGNYGTLDNLVAEVCNSAGIPPSADLCKVTSKQEANLNLEFPPELDYYVSAEPECSNFTKDKEEKNFAVDQLWACYDCVDSMPRFYAKIRKVRSSKEIQITWLEPQPECQSEIDWVKTGLPVACGKFACTSSEDTLSHLCFSHQICAKNLNSNCYVIYPRKGEIWAIFKDWHITWKSDPKNHDQFLFEIVEVVSDFNDITGVRIAHLEKVNGFLSLFRRKTQVGSPYSRILSCELLKFSHQVPSFRINESETDGVPKGCLELDPASLPDSFTITCSPGKVNSENRSRDAIKRYGKGQVNPTINSMILKTATKAVGLDTECSPSSTRKERSKQLGGFQDQGSADFLTSKRHGSLETKFSSMQTSKTRLVADCSHSKAQKGSLKDLNGFKDQEFNDNFCPWKKHGSSDTIPLNISKSLIVYPGFSADDLSSEGFHKFREDKSISKFKPGQLWALYGQKDDTANYYVQIMNVESALMLVYATLLESTHPPPSSCGMFRVCKGEPEIFFPSSFSHKVKAKQFGDDKYAICPWKGEIWAMHKSWNDKRLGFVLQSCEFDIVEVLKCNKENIEVSSLIPQAGFKSVFMAPSKLPNKPDIRKVLWSEISLFSHRIPAFQLNDEHSSLVAGCVQLDPLAFPVNMLK
ncbi:hypothetical protein AgCh_038490 [Apium graveolens]